MLVTKLQATPLGAGSYRLSFAPASGNAVNLTLNATYLHSFCHLLQRATAQAEWSSSRLAEPVVEERPRRLM